MRSGIRNLMSLAILALPLFVPGPAKADDILDQINKVIAAYGENDIRTAAKEAETTLALLLQRRAALLVAALPPAPAGWTIAQTQSRPEDVFKLNWTADLTQGRPNGPAKEQGSDTALRNYNKGDDWVTVSILIRPDGSMTQIFSRGGFPTNGQAFKEGNAWQKFVGGRYLVIAEGGGIPDEILKQFLNAIDFRALKNLSK